MANCYVLLINNWVEVSKNVRMAACDVLLNNNRVEAKKNMLRRLPVMVC